MKAQLPTPVQKPKMYLDSPDWGMQQKMDGKRILLEIVNGKVRAFNRHGVEITPPFELDTQMIPDCVLDGEWLAPTFFAFDMITNSVDSYWTRHIGLSKTFQLDAYNKNIVVLPLFCTDSKQDKFDELFARSAEGVVFKKLAAKPKQGKSHTWVKYKFTSDVDCVVISVGEDKSNLFLGMYKDGELVEIGKSSSLTGDGPSLKAGDVCKVNCLYVTESGRLYQPVKPMYRDDKLPTECTIDQLDSLQTNKDMI